MSASGMLYGPPVPASGAAAESLASAGHRAAMSFPVGKPISLAEASADVQQAVRAAQEQAKAAMVAEAQLASMAKAKAKAAAAAAAAVTSPAISGLTGLAAADGVTAAANTAAAAANRRAVAMAAAAGSPTLASIQGMSAPMVSSAFARQQQQQLLQLQQQQQQQQQQSTVFASILARQSHAAKLAELAAVEYERAALDLEQATAAQQRQAQAVMAMSQVGGASPYEVAMVQAQMLGEQMRLQGQMMPGASAAIAATRTGGMMMPSMMALRAQQVQMQQQQQQQQSREAHAMQAPGQTKVSVAAPAPAQTPAPAPAPAPKAEQRQPQASSVAANGVKQTKTTAIAPETSTVDTKTKKGEAPSKSAMEDELDAAEAVLSLMRGGVRRPSLAHQDTTKAAATATTTSNAVSEGQDKSNLAVKGQKPSKPTAAASTLFAPSAQMLLQAATLESTSTDNAEGKTESKRKRASRRSSTDSKSSEASGDESGQGKKQKRTRSKKKPGQPRRPLSAYNIFFSEERARIIKSMDEEMDGDEDNGGVEEGQDIPLMKDASANGPLKNRRMSLESTEGTPSVSACSSPALSVDEVGAVAGQKAQQMLLDRRINPAGPDRSKRLHRRTHGRISFQDLARQIGQRWKALPADRMDEYKRLAEIDMKRYKEDMVVWNAQQQQQQEQK